jgi:cytochrome c
MRAWVLSAIFVLAACGAPQEQEAQSAPEQDQPIDAAAQQLAVESLPTPYDDANYEAGRRVFAQCRSCHVVASGAPHRVGPNLHGMFGREIGTAPDFTYSQAVQDADFVWDAEQLDHWLQNPQTFLPGNRMAFAGVRNETQRRDLIAYLMIEAAE